MQWKTGLLGTVSLLTIATITKAGLLDEWSWLNPKPQGNGLNAVAFGGARFVAVGNGAIVTSDDGQHWTDQTFTNLSMLGIAYGAERFVAVGTDTQLMSSTNGAAWKVRSFGYGSLHGVCHGSHGFVAVGGTISSYGFPISLIVNSADGETWAASTGQLAFGPLAVAFGNGTYVAVGVDFNYDANEPGIAVSTTSTNWITLDSVTNVYLKGIAFGNGLFVAAGAIRSTLKPVVLTSSNAVDWNSFSLPSISLEHVSFDGSRFIITGDQTAYISADGISWTSNRVINTVFSLQGSAGGNGQLICVGGGGTIAASTNGIEWTNLIPNNELFRGVAFKEPALVVVGNSGISTSTDDGVTWHLSTVTNKPLMAVVTNGGQFVVVGSEGTVLISSNGNSWSQQNSGTTNSLNAIACADQRLVAVGAAGTIISSENGIDWSLKNSGTTNHLNGIAYGNGAFVGIGDKGTLITSPDAQNWTVRVPFSPSQLVCVAFGRGMFAVAGSYGYLWTSIDGVNWTNRLSGPQNIYGLTYLHRQFLALGSSGSIRTSVNGASWPLRRCPAGNSLNGACAVRNTVMAVGYAGTILQSSKVLQLLSPNRVQDAFSIRVVGEAGTSGRLEWSSDFSKWNAINTFTNTGNPVVVSDTSDAPARFYRVIQD
jgi:hypothetical protein